MRQKRISEFLPTVRDYYLIDDNGKFCEVRLGRPKGSTTIRFIGVGYKCIRNGRPLATG